MMTWTNSARDRLEGYLARLRESLQASGADAGEVSDDIRRHLSEEARASRMEVVTCDDVDRLLRRIGAPEASGGQGVREAHRRMENASPQLPSPAPGPAAAAGRPRHGFALFFGVILPLATLGIELATHMCAATFFNPIPTWWHVALVGAVPGLNLAAWWSVRERTRARLPWVGAGNAFGIGVSVYYSLLFLPLLPAGLIGVIFLGVGLLPLAPVLSLGAAWRLRWLMRETAGEKPGAHVPGWWPGLAAAGAALAILVLPPGLTRHWSGQYVQGSAEQRRAALAWLRTVGHERTLLADCYGSTRWEGGAFGFARLGRPVSAGEARDIYYLVTGRAFNTVAPPQAGFSSRSWEFIDEFSWDAEQGGTTVGGRLRGLSLAQSRLDGMLDADAAWSYVEWTLEFKNIASTAREARAQIALPPGGVVSRLTLWVNGEEREAAFAGASQVRSAYEQVVKVQRRDPVLVTRCGPDRVLMQCFPVPADGGTIKVRLGITAPLHLETAQQAVLRWPAFLERNFSISGESRHSLWIQGPQPLASGHAGLLQDRTKPGVHALHGELLDADLARPTSLVRATRDPSIRAAWVEDPREEGRLVRQTIGERSEPAPRRVVLVVDGAEAMVRSLPAVAQAIRRMPEGIEFSLLLARDGVEELAGTGRPRRGDSALYEQAAKELLGRAGVGGQDNVPALARGWDLAAEVPESVVIWVHAGQPQLFENGEMLKQRLDWRSTAGSSQGPVIYELQTELGPDRVLERIGGNASIRSVARFGTVQEDLDRLVGGWRSRPGSLGLVRERGTPAQFPEAARGKRSSKHLARLWANDEILRLVRANELDQAVQLAGQYQLVTMVSGAVVLETKEQFVQAGLQAVDPRSVPMVPEPATWVLLVVGAGAILGSRWMRGRRRNR